MAYFAKSLMLYYAVIPILRLPRNISSTFTYSSEDRIELGTLVRIVFRKRLQFGLVVKRASKPRFATLRINSVGLFRFPSWHLQLLEALPQEMYEHPATIVRAVLNKVSWSRVMMAGVLDQSKRARKSSQSSMRQKIYRSFQERLLFLSHIALETQKKKDSLLIIIPSLPDAKRVYQKLVKEFPELELYLSETGPQSLTQWIVSPQPHMIVSTRIGIFLPVRFDTIVCDDEPNELYVHPQPAPTYDTRVIAQIVSRCSRSRLIRSGFSLTSNLYPNTSIYRYIDVTNINATWIDMKEEVQKGNFLFSEYALKDINQTQLLFITSSKSFSQRVVCRDCGYTFSCSQCDRPYRALTEHKLICPSCGNQDSLPPFCPSCGGTQFSYLRIGAEQIKTRLKQVLSYKEVPKNIRVCALSEIESFDLPHGTKIIIVSLESLLTSEFNSFEHLVHKLIKLRKSFQGELVIQYRSDSLRRQLSNLPRTIAWEMSIRKKFAYPPFGNLYTIRYRPRSKKFLAEETRRLVADSFAVPLDSLVYWSAKKRGLPFMEFSVRVKKNHPFDWKSLPQEFHITKT